MLYLSSHPSGFDLARYSSSDFDNEDSLSPELDRICLDLPSLSEVYILIPFGVCYACQQITDSGDLSTTVSRVSSANYITSLSTTTFFCLYISDCRPQHLPDKGIPPDWIQSYANILQMYSTHRIG
jgi:hypothetical protein